MSSILLLLLLNGYAPSFMLILLLLLPSVLLSFTLHYPSDIVVPVSAIVPTYFQINEHFLYESKIQTVTSYVALFEVWVWKAGETVWFYIPTCFVSGSFYVLQTYLGLPISLV
jgi:hypothetical protein